MNENENLVTEEVAENVEQTTEESPKTYTESEFNAKLNEVLGKKIARKEAKIRKEYEQKYGDLEGVLRAGTGKENIGEITDTFKQYYTGKGVPIPKSPSYTDSDIATLARADADEVIGAGDDEVNEELQRLNAIGARMTPREKAVYTALSQHRDAAQRNRELAEIGVTEDVYNGDAFKRFAAKFKSDVPIKEVYENFRKLNPKKEAKTTGSMKNAPTKEVKDFYSAEDISKLSLDDLRNDDVWKNVRRSMTGAK